MSIQVVKIREFKGHSQAVYTMCKGTDDDSFYSAGADGMLVRWRLQEEDGELLARHESAVYSLFSDKSHVLSGTSKGILSVFDRNDFKSFRHIQVSGSPIFDMIRWNQHILIAAGDGCLYMLNSDFEPLDKIKLSEKSLRKLELMDAALAVASSDGVIRILDAQLSVRTELKAQNSSVFSLAYHHARKVLISGGIEAVLCLYQEDELIKTVKAHLLHIHHIALNDTQTLYLTCSMDKTIKIWDAADDGLLKVIDSGKYGGHTSSVNKILWFDKNNFISCSDDRTLKCFEILKK